ncbi:periplasmic binding protein-like I [Obelidium mucronatum]|nr:periplasmic binding protein-like I [Obelidium mucronatum]
MPFLEQSRWLFFLFSVYPVWCQTFIDPVIGFYPGQSMIPSKQNSNITIAFLLPYRLILDYTTMSEYDDCMFCSWIRQMDSGAELAVERINNDSTILPNTMVHVLRVQSWDQGIDPGDTMGGAAAVALELANEYEISGVVGETSDLSTMLTAGILSQFKIPFCGGVQNLPALSDKDDYPYYFRVTFSNKWGQDIALLLNLWNVKRVALVYDVDDIESKGACMDIKNNLFSNDIVILANRYYHGLRSDNDYDAILNEFRLVDARYIILCAQAWSNAYYFVEAAKKVNFTSPDHLWFVTQPPYPPDYDGGGTDPRLDFMEGMIYIAPKSVSPSDPARSLIESEWARLYEIDPLKYQTDHLNWASAGPFDCVGTLLYGFDKILRNNPHYTAQMLTSPQLRNQLKFNAFEDTGFNGTLLNPMKLDSFGDIAASTVFIMLNSTFWGPDGSQRPFAQIDKFSRSLGFHGSPVFNGGLTSPPNDGSIIMPVFIPSIYNYQGKFIIILVAIGYIVCAGFLVIVVSNRKTTEIRTLHAGHTLVTLLGSIFILTGFLSYLIPPTTALCYLRRWLTWTGIPLLISPLIMKTLLVYTVYSKKTVQKGIISRNSRYLSYGNAVILAGNSAILAYSTFVKDFGPIAFTSKHQVIHKCSNVSVSSRNSNSSGGGVSTITLLYLYNGLLLLSLGFAALSTNGVKPIHNETSLFAIFIPLFLLLAIIISSVPFDEYYAMKQVIGFWIVAVGIPILRIGPRAVQLANSSSSSSNDIRKFLNSNHYWNNGKQTTSDVWDDSQQKSTATTKSVSHQSRTNTNSKSAKNEDSSFVIQVNVMDLKMVYRLTYKLRYIGLSYHSNWSFVSSAMLCELNEKRWIHLISEDTHFALSGTQRNLLVETAGNCVFLQIPTADSGQRGELFQPCFMEAEFACEADAIQFMQVVDTSKS